MKKIPVKLFPFLATGFLVTAAATVSQANGLDLCYDVTVTNMTHGQVFTPVLVATHKRNVTLFSVGEPASDELAQLAEGGATDPLAERLDSMGNSVGHIAVSDEGPFVAGESVTVQVPANRRYNRISLASMLAITNDGFVGLNNVRLRPGTYVVPVYDAGTEDNDEFVTNIPGTGGEGYNPVDGEGFVHIHAGIHGIGDLPAPENLDWRNPAAKVTINLTHCDYE